jgi:hypothetical protein
MIPYPNPLRNTVHLRLARPVGTGEPICVLVSPMLADIRARALASPIPPPRLRLSEWIEREIVLQGVHRDFNPQAKNRIEIAHSVLAGGNHR